MRSIHLYSFEWLSHLLAFIGVFYPAMHVYREGGSPLWLLVPALALISLVLSIKRVVLLSADSEAIYISDSGSRILQSHIKNIRYEGEIIVQEVGGESHSVPLKMTTAHLIGEFLKGLKKLGYVVSEKSDADRPGDSG